MLEIPLSPGEDFAGEPVDGRVDPRVKPEDGSDEGGK
jgi:hypothetical protein